MTEKVRGQNLEDAIGTFRTEQTQDGSWMVKVGSKGYCLGIYETQDEAKQAILAACKRANEKRSINADYIKRQLEELDRQSKESEK